MFRISERAKLDRKHPSYGFKERQAIYVTAVPVRQSISLEKTKPMSYGKGKVLYPLPAEK